MSKLQELIRKLCPNGVEYKKLGDICEIKRGERVVKSELLKDGCYPVISGGVSPMGYLNVYSRESETITVAQYGTAGYVNWQTTKFWTNDVCYCLFPKFTVDKKYLY